MDLEIRVENSLLGSEMKIARDQFQHLLNVGQRTLHSRYNHEEIEEAGVDSMLEKASLLFAGTYNALKKKIATEAPEINTQRVAFKRSYLAYCASEAVLQYVSSEFNGEELVFEAQSKKPNVNSDAALITSALKGLNTGVSSTNHLVETRGSILSYFSEYKHRAKRELVGKEFKDAYKQAKRTTIISDLFRIEGIDEPAAKVLTEKVHDQTKIKASTLFEKPPHIIRLDELIQAKDILGNQRAKEDIKESVFQLFANDPVQGNPFDADGGLRDIYLLAGDSGTGKTMLAQYAISEAVRLSKGYSLPFQAVEIELDDAHQDGPVQIARYQFNWIVEKNIPTIVLFDEAEDKCRDRGQLSNATHKIAVTNEILRFTDGISYPKGAGRLSFFLSNRPYDIDKALRDRAQNGIYHCQGPTTPEEKGTVLRNNLHKSLQKRFIKVDAWEQHGELCYELDLKGRQLREIAKSVVDGSRTNHYPQQFFHMSYEQKLKEIRKRHKPVTDEILQEHIYKIANKKDQVLTAAQEFNQQ